MTLLLCLFGFISGITTALFGFGGGFITVPLLYALITLVWGPESEASAVAMQIAVATSTCVMIFSASLSSRAHYRKGHLNWSIIRPFIIPISLGGILGAFIALSVDSEWIRWLFIGYLVITILDCLIRPGFMKTHTEGITPSGGGVFADIPIGLVIGAVAAFLGVGGECDDGATNATSWGDDDPSCCVCKPTNITDGDNRNVDLLLFCVNGTCSIRCWLYWDGLYQGGINSDCDIMARNSFCQFIDAILER